MSGDPSMPPREGMMAVVRNRLARVVGVEPFDAAERGRLHLVEVEYTDGLGAESERLLWEIERGAQLLEPAALPAVVSEAPMDAAEFDALVRAARWSALTPALPFSGLEADRRALPLAAPLFGAIDAEAWQLVPVLRALEMPRVALLLADAVGLGKTVQAGMILRELMLRRRIRRVLILCPASLRTQWREEMAEKFSVPFQVVDGPSVHRLQREYGLDVNPWRGHERVIASVHYLKQPNVLEQFRSVAAPDQDGRLRWDLLVVDEAHNLAPAPFGEDSDLSRMLQIVAPWFEHRVFLTATPHNGHTRSFSGLLEALDPLRFTRTTELSAADRARVATAVIRRRKSEINRSYQTMGEAPRFSERRVEALEVLRPSRDERALQTHLYDLCKALRSATAKGAPRDRTAVGFAVEVLQKRLLSGPWAFGQSWRHLLEGLAGQDAPAEDLARVHAVGLDDTDNDPERESRQRQAHRTVGAWMRKWQEAVTSEIEAVTKTVDALGVDGVAPGGEPETRQRSVALAAAKVKGDTRLKRLEDLIAQRLRRERAWRDDERLVVFTEYLATLEYLSARLRQRYGEGDWLVSLYGGLDDEERDAVKRAFNDRASAARVLVATDAAGEGLNLQRSCRLLLHWDIPWNPGRMEQRNGRVDRYGQARDVELFHFDSPDDASMRFLGRVLFKRSQTREDHIATDDIFARAVLDHFEHDEDPAEAEARLDRAIVSARATQNVDDIPDDVDVLDAAERDRVARLRSALDLSPDTLRETLETALAVGAGRPRLQPDGPGRYRLAPPVPSAWEEVVDEALRVAPDDGRARRFGPLPALVFDPTHYVNPVEARPVFRPEPDSRLMHLGHPMIHRALSTFARARYPGSGYSATRWIASHGDPRVLLTLEVFAINELREPCLHEVVTVMFELRTTGLERPRWDVSPELKTFKAGDVDAAREAWDGVSAELKRFVRKVQKERTARLAGQLQTAYRSVKVVERSLFDQRRKEITKAVADTTLAKLERDVEKIRERTVQMSLYPQENLEDQRKLRDKEAEIALRKRHYDAALRLLSDEERRTLEHLLPKRYRLHGEVQVLPVAVEVSVRQEAR
ncbi:MAG: DEAD/DEAH box helicase [Deltaproteobacteria bacterium]|nr:DEAD/DEAH box helicase [Deltaproteobacteria bacterium]